MTTNKKLRQDGAVEVTTFHLVKGKTLTDFLNENKVIDIWLKEQPGFRSRHIFEGNLDLIHDLVFWDDENQGVESMKNLMEVFSDSKIHELIDQASVTWFIKPVFKS